MPLKFAFENIDDFMATLRLTEEKAMPLIEWLDTFEGDTHGKISSAIFFLIARQRMIKNHVSKTEMLRLVSIIYDVVNDNDYSKVPWRTPQ